MMIDVDQAQDDKSNHLGDKIAYYGSEDGSPPSWYRESSRNSKFDEELDSYDEEEEDYDSSSDSCVTEESKASRE